MRQYLGLDVAPLRIGWAVVSENAGVIKPIAHGTHLFDKKEWIVPAMRAEAMEDLHDAHKIEPIGIGMCRVCWHQQAGQHSCCYGVGTD
jgi:hypothetical protein